MSDYYNQKGILDLFNEGFSRTDLRILCFELSGFSQVYEDWGEVGSKQDFVLNLLTFAKRQLLVESLLDWAKTNNPRRYEQGLPYQPSEGYSSEEGALSKIQQAGLCLPNNDLGKGIFLGGEYRDIALKIVATEWFEYGSQSWARSGWLYVPQWTENHAITFFKLHANADGKGYIHLLDAADPPHVIWLTTDRGTQIKKAFHYEGHPADVWHFSWEGAEK